MRENLSEKDCLAGLVKLARIHPEAESVLCSAISYIAGICYEAEQRDQICRDTFVAHGAPRPLDLSARPVDRDFYKRWIDSQKGFDK